MSKTSTMKSLLFTLTLFGYKMLQAEGRRDASCRRMHSTGVLDHLVLAASLRVSQRMV